MSKLKLVHLTSSYIWYHLARVDRSSPAWTACYAGSLLTHTSVMHRATWCSRVETDPECQLFLANRSFFYSWQHVTDLDNWRIDDMFTPSLPWKVITWELSPALSEGDNCLLISSYWGFILWCELDKTWPNVRYTLCSIKNLKGITHGGFFIYIKLGILSLCTEPWHGTRSISISLDFCLYWKAIWWVDYVYRCWLWIHTHLSTTFNLTLNCLLILTHSRRSDQYCRV